MKTSLKCRSLSLLVLIATCLGSAKATQTAVQFDDSSFYVGQGGWGVYGWGFSTTLDLRVVSVGLYDYYRGNGLEEQHTVGIWDITNPSSTVLSTTIPAGTAALLVNDFRYVDVNPVVLAAGHDYVIAALYIQGDATLGEVNHPLFAATLGPGVEFIGRRWGGLSSPVLVFPTQSTPGQWESFGPNFTYTVVPEPTSLGLLVPGIALFVVRRRRSATKAGPLPAKGCPKH